MKLTVKRIRQGKDSTLSEIYLNGEFFCYGLEDLVRDEKIKGSTAIPAGTYRLQLNTYGAMNARYKRRFPDMHRGMIEISGIPNFTYVYIHIGNNFGDTAGCLLVGDGYIKDDDGDYILLKSAKAYKRLYAVLVDVVGDVVIELKGEESEEGEEGEGEPVLNSLRDEVVTAITSPHFHHITKKTYENKRNTCRYLRWYFMQCLGVSYAWGLITNRGYGHTGYVGELPDVALARAKEGVVFSN